tara:strand:- start:2554 stop:3456 length:903 start_codon:yes stop_codon:yes gene_type:complete
LKKLLFFLFIINFKIYSQSENLEFLNISENSKIRGIGGDNVSLIKNQNYFFSNPALLSYSNKNITFNYLSYILDINASSILYSDSIKYIGNYGIGVKYFSHGKFDSYDAFGNSLGSFHPKEFVINLGKSVEFKKISIGTNFKFFNSKMYEKTYTGIIIDLGLIYIPNPQKQFSLGAVIKNFGVTLNTDNNEIPFMILIGSTFKPDYMPLRFSLTYARSNIKYDNLIIGGEVLLSKFINVQLGYNQKIGSGFDLPTSKKLKGISYGFELLLKKININYSKSVLNPISGSNCISISYNLKRM